MDIISKTRTSAVIIAAISVAQVASMQVRAQCDPQLDSTIVLTLAGFGRCVSVSGDTAILGAWQEDLAFLYRRTEGQWLIAGFLPPPDLGEPTGFGYRVAIDGDTALVSAIFDDEQGDNAGAVHVYRKIAGAWQHIAKLTAGPGTNTDFFGRSVALRGNTAVVGAGEDYPDTIRSSAFVFREKEGQWQQVAKLAVPDTIEPQVGTANPQVAISGDTVFVGEANIGLQVGALYVYREVGSIWPLVAKLQASDASSLDAFGWSMAADDHSVVVGALGAGAAYIFREIGGIWHQISQLHADNTPGGYFGSSVGLSDDIAVVGSVYPLQPLGLRRVYVFREAGSTWQQIATLGPESGSFGTFGYSVAVDDNILVAGAYDQSVPLGGGKAYFYDLNCPELADCNSNGVPDEVELAGNDCNLDGIPDDCQLAADDCNENGYLDHCEGVYNELAKLIAPDPSSSDSFGYSVAAAADTIVAVSNPLETEATAYFYERTNGEWQPVHQEPASGHAAISGDTAVVGPSVFRKMAGTWQAIATLSAPGGVSGGVAIDGDTAVVGSNVFREIDGTWQHVATLAGDDTVPGDDFGESVAAISGMIAVGAPDGDFSGSAYLFQESNGAWEQVAKLKAADAATGDRFGNSIALSGNTLLVGAYGDDDNGSRSGSAYLFRNLDGTWVQIAKLTADDAGALDDFGQSVALSGDAAIIGAYRNRFGLFKPGSAYVFRETGNSWLQVAKLNAHDATHDQYFGWSVSIRNGTTVIGAFGDDEAAGNGGAAYIFDLDCPPMDDCNENGVPDADELGGNDCNGNAVPDSCEPQGVSQVSSCREHGTAGLFCLPLGGFAREARAPGSLQLEVTLVADNACLVSGAVVECAATAYSGSATVTPLDAHTVGLSFNPPLPGADCCQVTLLAGEFEPFEVRTLAGDANGNGTVEAADMSAIKWHLGQTAGPDNFLLDLDANGYINGADITAIKPRIGNSAAACP